MALVIKSWLLLFCVEWIMHFRKLKALHGLVQNQKVHPLRDQKRQEVENLCRAMDIACIFYFKHVLCLQKSAATTLLLRRHGWPVEMVIGAKLLPFKSHAWVELDGNVVNDKPYIPEIYRVLERC